MYLPSVLFKAGVTVFSWSFVSQFSSANTWSWMMEVLGQVFGDSEVDGSKWRITAPTFFTAWGFEKVGKLAPRWLRQPDQGTFTSPWPWPSLKAIDSASSLQYPNTYWAPSELKLELKGRIRNHSQPWISGRRKYIVFRELVLLLIACNFGQSLSCLICRRVYIIAPRWQAGFLWRLSEMIQVDVPGLADTEPIFLVQGTAIHSWYFSSFSQCMRVALDGLRVVPSAPSLELWCFFYTMSDSGNTAQLAPQCTAPKVLCEKIEAMSLLRVVLKSVLVLAL